MNVLMTAEEMGYDTFDELQDNVAIILKQKSGKVQRLACVLWSLERFGDLSNLEKPAALHIELADNIFSVRGAREALIALLQDE